ncbi:hypothetical protein MWU59_09040 [Flavobacteriaceae bacterium F08102]|nr:hypothetical protein [Flavobacteriaceae bacterium F08102]
MKIYKYVVLFIIVCFTGCTPDKEEIFELTTNPERIDVIKLKTNSHILYADGVSTLNLSTRTFNIVKTNRSDNKLVLPDGSFTFKDSVHIDTVLLKESRIKEFIKYFKENGEEIPNGKMTTLNVENFKVYAKYEDVSSDLLEIEVREPLEAQPKIVIPVIFHIVQSSKVKTFPTIKTEDIQERLDEVNWAFMRSKFFASNGANANIEFKLALYDEDGDLLKEPGIHRVITSKERDEVKSTLVSNTWDPKKYLNIWVSTYSKSHTTPNTKLTGVESLGGLTFDNEIGPDDAIDMSSPENTGILMGASYSAYSKSYSWRFFTSNWKVEFGKYFGLLSCRAKSPDSASDPEDVDYCTDTYAYTTYINEDNWRYSIDDYLYDAINVMDEQSPSLVFSGEQVQRIRWVIENCPTHWAWKSDFALTGND